MFLLPKEYCRVSDLIGFEPNKVEYEKLIKNNTDAKKIFVEPNFQSKKYFNYALWKKKCKKKFFITKGPGALLYANQKKIHQRIQCKKFI